MVGDSRIYRGLDPGAFEQRLGGRCLNFGFSSAGFSRAYLDAIEQAIDPKAPRAIVVIGVTPWALTPASLQRNGFTDAVEQRRQTPWPVAWLQLTERARTAFDRYPLEQLWAARETHRAKAQAYAQVFHLNGWVESDYHPRDPERGLAIAAEVHAHDNRVSPAVLDQLEQRIATWRARGWIVVGFRPPTPPAVVRLTDELSGFDEAQVAARFQRAGAIWIPVSPDRFATYDGSHLVGTEAKRLSEELVREIETRTRP